MSRRKTMVFVWENFGPMHAERCDAVQNSVPSDIEVIGLELGGRSQVYDWLPESGRRFTKVTLFPGQKIDDVPPLSLAWRGLVALLRLRPAYVFLCHYEAVRTLIWAIVLRLIGTRVYVMNDSKFDDYTRYLHRELLKSLFYLPYNGGVASGKRSRDYMRFLGVSEKMIGVNYNSLSTDRVLRNAGGIEAPDGVDFADRDFIIVARLVPKKNLPLALKAFALYTDQYGGRRKLHICGSGPLEGELTEMAGRLCAPGSVLFHGFIQAEEVGRLLGRSLCLILPSTEEQFGNVVIEAQSVGLPVILGENCGARDELIRSGVNGFVIEPDNHVGLAYFMHLISSDRQLWTRFCLAAREGNPRGDVQQFADAVTGLVGL